MLLRGALFLSSVALAWASVEPGLIPQPAHLEIQAGVFRLTARSGIDFDGDEAVAQSLAAALRSATGYPLPVSMAGVLARSHDLTLRLQTSQISELGAEGYRLAVTPDTVTISAATTSGLFYGGRTLLQLLSPEKISTNLVKDFSWLLPCVTIADQPRFPWRGLMLDCSRTFQLLAYLHQTIDRMAAYKLNVLHLHLTDDQGWRIEIKKYPELTQKGAVFATQYGEPSAHQGFYTQAQLRELVAYATARHITIVPEIEMPGHSHEVMVCHPAFSCGGTTGGDIFPFFQGATTTADIFCAGNEDVFRFLQDVLDEVTGIFPSKYIHIGGDEVPKTAWHSCPKCQARMQAEGLKNERELQSYFVGRLGKYLAAKGRSLIGWDEILEGGLAPDATVMSWRGMSGGLAAARAGHAVVMSPTSHCYFDYNYGAIDSAVVFSFDPLAGIPPPAARCVLGLQANFWSHLDREPAAVDRQLFPRLLALAERGWSPDNRNEWAGFQRRARTQLSRLEQMGIHYQRFDLVAAIGEWTPASFGGAATTIDFDVSRQIPGPGDYLVKPVFSQGRHGVNLHSIELVGLLGVEDRHEGFAGSQPKNDLYALRVPPAVIGHPLRLRLTLDPAGGTNTWGKVYLVPATSLKIDKSL